MFSRITNLRIFSRQIFLFFFQYQQSVFFLKINIYVERLGFFYINRFSFKTRLKENNEKIVKNFVDSKLVRTCHEHLIKVSKSQKQIMASWILPKNERWGNFQYIKLPLIHDQLSHMPPPKTRGAYFESLARG